MNHIDITNHTDSTIEDTLSTKFECAQCGSTFCSKQRLIAHIEKKSRCLYNQRLKEINAKNKTTFLGSQRDPESSRESSALSVLDKQDHSNSLDIETSDDSSKNICNSCGSTFCSKQRLMTHIEQAKRCLRNQKVSMIMKKQEESDPAIKDELLALTNKILSNYTN